MYLDNVTCALYMLWPRGNLYYEALGASMQIMTGLDTDAREPRVAMSPREYT